jgi:hypothetical protein
MDHCEPVPDRQCVRQKRLLAIGSAIANLVFNSGGRHRVAFRRSPLMSATLRIVDDVVELDRQRVARLLPKLAPTLAYRLAEALDDADDSADHVLYLEGQIEDLKKQIVKLEEQARR